tara:strand:+ start:256 stop:468 length:213 start_codon:yes stop_codon:yes gene_type:complete
MIRYKWTNKLDLLDSYLQSGNLDVARRFAMKILDTDGVNEMLTGDEIEYLKAVIALNSLNDWMKGKTKEI